ncbi:hypothetical protein LCGC14_0450980 [marine sediment metagenome]|uniref:Uncharacterized protein n=1 Tax=marine sediment metagenome TaxID=412755 RepID=A0A0F9T113_9ZZZZ
MAACGVCCGVVGGRDGDLGDAVARRDAVTARGGLGTPDPSRGNPCSP